MHNSYECTFYEKLVAHTFNSVCAEISLFLSILYLLNIILSIIVLINLNFTYNYVVFIKQNYYKNTKH